MDWSQKFFTNVVCISFVNLVFTFAELNDCYKMANFWISATLKLRQSSKYTSEICFKGALWVSSNILKLGEGLLYGALYFLFRQLSTEWTNEYKFSGDNVLYLLELLRIQYVFVIVHLDNRKSAFQHNLCCVPLNSDISVMKTSL